MTAPPAGQGRRGPLTSAMCLCVALVVGTVSAVNLAIPDLSSGSLRPSAQAVLWIVDGYVAVFACLLIPAGALADRVGRKGTLLCGLGVFAAGSLVCATAPSAAVLIAGRMLSGVGAAAVLPTTLALLVGGLRGRPRQKAVSVWAAMTGLAAVLGNIGGGAALRYGGWRALFAATVPLALVALALAAAATPVAPRHHRPLAPIGTALLTSGVLALLYGIVSGPQHGWAAPRVALAFAAAVCLLGGWVAHERRSRHPLLDPLLLTLPPVRAGALGMALLFTGMFGLFYINGQYLQYAKGCSPLAAGVRLLPMAAALLAGPHCALPAQRVLGRRATVGLGMLVLAAGLGVVSTVGARTPYPVYACGASLTALGCGIATPLLTHAVMSALPAGRVGAGAGLQSLARELGSALGVAVAGSITTTAFRARLPGPLRGPRAPSTPGAALARAADPATRHGVVLAFTGSLDTAMASLAVVVALSAPLVACWLPAGEAEPADHRPMGRPA